MAIEYIEVRNAARVIIGIVDTAQSVIWHSKYYGVGDFEIYAKATPAHLNLFIRGYYITRPDDLEVGVIEHINIINNLQDGKMIIIRGRFAKSILERRLIYQLAGHVNTPTILRGNVEAAARSLVTKNAISCPFDASRNFDFLQLGALGNLPAVIRDESGAAAQKQVSYQNLLDYSDKLLQEYNYAAMIVLNDDTKKLQYVCYAGADRTIDNTAGNEPVIFSRDYDNLIESEYTEDDTAYKNVALIGGEGEDLKRFYSLLSTGAYSGLQRREIFVDASSINKKYKNDGEEQEREYTDAEYTTMLNVQGMQTLAPLKMTVEFSGVINTSFGRWLLNRDYMLGDLVTVQDNDINKYATVRITETTEVQDENGYTCEAIYE